MSRFNAKYKTLKLTLISGIDNLLIGIIPLIGKVKFKKLIKILPIK